MSADLEAITLDVTRRAGRLSGSAEAAAVLESMGIGDDQARAMERANVFRLATDVVAEQDRSPALGAASEVERKRRRARTAPAGAHPVAGAIAIAVPLAASLAAIPILTGTLWNGGQAAIARATAVGIGAAASFTVTVGFVLAMAAAVGRTGRRRAALGAATAGVVAAGAAGLGLWALMTAEALVPPAEVGVALQYFALLSALWLAVGLAVGAGRAAWATVAMASGAGTAIALRIAGHVSLIAGQRAGILAAAFVAVVAASWPSARRDRGTGVRQVRPRLRLRSSAGLVSFGAAFAALLFLPQVSTWYSQSPPHDWVLALRPDVEAGWCWAVAAVTGVIAIAVAVAEAFVGTLRDAADRTPLTAAHRMSAEARSARRRATLWLVAAAVGGAAVSSAIMLGLTAASTSFADVVTADTTAVFAVVFPGLVVAACAALDAAILFAMGPPRVPLAGALAGMAVAGTVAVGLAKLAVGWAAAIGLDAGALVTWAVGFTSVRRLLRTPDVAFATRPEGVGNGAGSIP